MFAPDPYVGAAATARLAAGSLLARRGGKPPSLPIRPRDVKQYVQEAQTSTCPNGHALEGMVLPARSNGACNGCGRKTKAGAWFMVCQQCNFGLCESCAGDPQDDIEDLDGEDSSGALSNLCALGFSYSDARNALKAANGDAEQAAALLLAAVEMDIQMESQAADVGGVTDTIVID